MTRREPMTLERFLELTEAYGAALERFPESERSAARALLLSSKQAQAVRAEAAALDAALDAVPSIEPSARLKRAVLSIPGSVRPHWWPFRGAVRSALALSAAAALGVLVGRATLEESSTASLSGDDYRELSALAFGAEFTEESFP